MGNGLPEPVRPLLSGRAGSTAGVVLAGCAVFTAAAGYICARDTDGDVLDGPIDSWATAHLGNHVQALQLTADLGQGGQVAALTAALILACLAARRVNGAILALISVPLAAALTELVLKPLVNQYYSSFPSGRAVGIFAVVSVAAVLLTDPPRTRLTPAARLGIVLAGVLIGCAVAAATIGLAYHRFTDVAAGAAVGTGVVIATTFLLDLPGSRRLLAMARFPWRRP